MFKKYPEQCLRDLGPLMNTEGFLELRQLRSPARFETFSLLATPLRSLHLQNTPPKDC